MEHAYTYAAAALIDQVDRALSAVEGEPARVAVEKKYVLTFKPPSETRDRTHPYTGEMGLRLAPTCPDCTG